MTEIEFIERWAGPQSQEILRYEYWRPRDKDLPVLSHGVQQTLNVSPNHALQFQQQALRKGHQAMRIRISTIKEWPGGLEIWSYLF